MAGLIGVGRNTQAQAMSGLSTVAGLEAARERQAEQIRAARRAQTMSMVGQGAGMGASLGLTKLMSAGGAAAGAAGASMGGAAAAGAAGTAAATGASLGGAAATGAAATGAAATGAAATGAAATGTAAAAGGGMMATLGAIAPPLLLGVGAALLLDQVFDIF